VVKNVSLNIRIPFKANSWLDAMRCKIPVWRRKGRRVSKRQEKISHFLFGRNI
jgi:hypothetical protein